MVPKKEDHTHVSISEPLHCIWLCSHMVFPLYVNIHAYVCVLKFFFIFIFWEMVKNCLGHNPHAQGSREGQLHAGSTACPKGIYLWYYISGPIFLFLKGQLQGVGKIAHQ